MRKFLAILTGKILITVGKILKKRTTSAPGEYALRICPDLIKNINSYVKKGIIVTCGTNGKTTTNNLICSALEGLGYKVMCNRVGANMTSGVATAYIEEANLFGKTKCDYACFEVDEAYTPVVFKHFIPDILVVTNLFRDQLDRYGETATTSAKIKQAISMAPSIKLVLNGDDPLCVQFGRADNAKSYYFATEEKVTDTEPAKEGRFCPVCNAELDYEYYHYSQLGMFSCPGCDFKRPAIDFKVNNVKLTPPVEFDINGQRVVTNQKGFYNIYNMSAVYGVLNVLGEDNSDFSKLLACYKPQTGRLQEFKFENKSVILSLSKNPAGFNQAIATVNTDTRKKDVIIAVNDLVGDGRDVSWLWDVEFEKLVNDSVNTLTLTGRRMFDLALRFKYSDINVGSVTDDMHAALEAALASDSEVVYAIINYTAMFPTEEILNKMLKEKGGNK